MKQFATDVESIQIGQLVFVRTPRRLYIALVWALEECGQRPPWRPSAAAPR